MEALVQKNKNLKQAGDILAHISQDPAERAFADAREKFLWDQEVREGRAREEGREEGIEIGEKRGEKRGIEIGEKRGREIGRREVAKAMLAAGVAIETVCKATGLNKTDLIS